MFLYNPTNLHLDEIFTSICHPDYARMFLHILLATAYKFHSKEDEYVPLQALLLRKQIHAKKTEIIKNTLIKHGIIECDGIYSPKLKCYGYRLAKKYHNKIEAVKTTSKILIKKAKSREPALNKPQHVAIWKWLNKVKIDYTAAAQLLVNTKNISQKSLMLEKLRSKDLFFCEDERGRVYHNVACLWSKFRQFLSINEINLVNIDIKNSQPLIFSKLLKDYYSIVISTKSDAPFPPDVSLFVRCVEDGSLYDFLMEEFGVEKKRNYFKKKFFAEIFYARTGVETNLRKQFGELFPNVTKVINHYKRDDYRDLPLEMQRIEAELMIDKVCGKLGSIPFLTVHDSILTLPEHVDYVKIIIMDVFKEVGLRPSFGV